MFFKKYDIGIIGDLCSNDMNLADTLSKLGPKVLVLDKTHFGKQTEIVDNYHNGTNSYDVYSFKSSMDFYRKACSCRVLMSFTASVLGPLKPIYPLRFLPCFPPIVNIATGSDTTEFLGESSFKAFLYRLHLRTSALNWMVEYPHALKNIQKFNIQKTYFFPFPAFRLPETRYPLPESGRLKFFHPAHLDWKATDSSPNRNSTKGNDRFLRSFIKAVNDGLDAECIILDRGSDREQAKKIVNESGIADRFIWKKNLSRDELFKTFEQCHVVVDQFDVGAVGGIAAEAMASGRPVMTYIQENCSRLQYGGDTPPVINCWSEDEIYKQLMACNNHDFLQEKASRLYRWVHRQHNPEVVCDRILFFVFKLTGRRFKDYGWEKDAYASKK